MKSRSPTAVEKSSGKSISALDARLEENAERKRHELLTGPFVANAMALKAFAGPLLGGDFDIVRLSGALGAAAQNVNLNDLNQVEATLTSQAAMLNLMFADLTRRSGINLNGGNQFSSVGEAYFKMAMKAQNQCRMTLETLANIKNPPVVYARQANITNGPQQVNNGSASSPHATETKKSAKQSIGGET